MYEPSPGAPKRRLRNNVVDLQNSSDGYPGELSAHDTFIILHVAMRSERGTTWRGGRCTLHVFDGKIVILNKFGQNDG